MGARTSVFLLSGNRLLREALVRVLSKRADIEVAGASACGNETSRMIEDSGCEVLLLDATTSEQCDLGFVRRFLGSNPGIKVVLIGMEEDEKTFLNSVRAGVSGYVLQAASASDIANAVRTVANEEAFCSPRLCMALFKYIEREKATVPNVRIRVSLGLTRRQQQLLPLIAEGLTNKEIASHLHLSEQTIKNHVHRMLQRVGVGDRLSVVEMVRREGMQV